MTVSSTVNSCAVLPVRVSENRTSSPSLAISARALMATTGTSASASRVTAARLPLPSGYCTTPPALPGPLTVGSVHSLGPCSSVVSGTVGARVSTANTALPAALPLPSASAAAPAATVTVTSPA